MKNLFTLLIIAVGLFASSTTFAQGTKDAPQPGSEFNYGLTSADNADFTWWVASNIAGDSKLVYGTDYSIDGYPTLGGHPAGVANLKDVDITWGSNLATLPATLYVFVESDIAGCKNRRYYTVTPANNIDLALYDVTGSLNPETSEGADNNSTNHCPEFGAPYSSDDAAYNAGKTEVQVRIKRLSSVAAWSFDFAVSGVGVVASDFVYSTDGTSATAAGVKVSASADANYVLVTFNVNNVPGNPALSITYTVTNGADANLATDDVNPTPATHVLKIMPAIGAFN